MNKKGLLTFALLLPLFSSCSLVKGLEKDVTVVFEYNDQIISKKVVNQFNNCLVPSLSDKQIPINNEFFGWTWLDPDSIDINRKDFKETYIEKDGVVHYNEISSYTTNSSITLRPLFYNIDEIPVPNYYIAIGWYAKESTSGLNQSRMDKWEKDLKDYLVTEGATEEDLANVVINAYDGDVATAGSLINKDRYIDILVGFGGNINSTGGVNVLENIGGIPMGPKTRYVARLTEKDIVKKVFTWLQTEDGYKSLS